MANNNANGNAAMQREVTKAFGSVSTGQNPFPPQKENVMLFRKDRVYASLDLKSTYDEKKGEYSEPVPRLTTSSDGVFFNLPMDSEFLKEYAAFLLKLSQALEGIFIDNTVVSDDVGNAKRMLQKYRKAA